MGHNFGSKVKYSDSEKDLFRYAITFFVNYALFFLKYKNYSFQVGWICISDLSFVISRNKQSL
ncbi:MAG TPA: hypothetical protein VN704_12285 [Verrucomicrobiae bacterium]|nr:hypothetical protein [Verrucomicrobiae bacterium]